MTSGAVAILAALGRSSTGVCRATAAEAARASASTDGEYADVPKAWLRNRHHVEDVRELVRPDRQAGPALERAPARVAREQAERAARARDDDPVRRADAGALLGRGGAVRLRQPDQPEAARDAGHPRLGAQGAGCGVG